MAHKNRSSHLCNVRVIQSFRDESLNSFTGTWECHAEDTGVDSNHVGIHLDWGEL